MTAQQFETRANASLEAVKASEIETNIDSLHRTAETLQAFAAQSKRKLSKGKALEQASILSGFKDYQTAKAAIEDRASKTLALSKLHMSVFLENNKDTKGQDGGPITRHGVIKPWESDRGFKNGTFLFSQDDEYVSIKLYKEGEPESALEVVLEMDVDLPRLCIYRPELSDEPIFSVHADKPGVVLQYMTDDDQMFHKNRANEAGTEMIKKVAHASKGVWFVPTREES